MMDEEITTLTGTVETVVFHNEDNGWTVLEMDCDGELITVVGKVARADAGDELRVMGRWVNHPSYGRQFKAGSFERSLPNTAEAILKYLSSGAIKGIGAATAKKIVKLFGVGALDVLEKAPEKLTQIKGITAEKARKISEAYREQFGVRSCMLFLQQYNFSASEALRVWKRWGIAAVDMIRQNPYIVCSPGLSISFERADLIAQGMGIEGDDPARIAAGVQWLLRQSLYSAGNTCAPYDRVVEAAAKRLHCAQQPTENAVDRMVSEKALVERELDDKPMLFLPEAFAAEEYIAGRLALALQLTPPVLGDCGTRIDALEEQLGLEYAEQQRRAILTACSKNLMVLTGGPGTGKTTTINAIIRIYEEMGLKVALAAPTGRAAKRMSEVCGREAKTIHRLLEVEFSDDDTPRFARNEQNPLDCDAIIVDELSMVDVMLLESLLHAMRLACRLVMVGDANQLPPVGAGNALHDMIESGAIPCVALDRIFRQAAKSLIVLNAHRIVRGEMPDLSCRDRDFFFLPQHTAEGVAACVRELVGTRLPAAYGFSPLWDIQVLTPGRKGELGVNDLNPLLQQALNPPGDGKAERSMGSRLLREGDKVMQIRNNYNLVWKREDGEHGTGVYNGDIGLLEHIDTQSGVCCVRFDDRTAEYAPEALEELELAYAVTVHKSQGSEFRAVVLPLFSGAPLLFYRNLLYTAVTRARELVILVGRQEIIARMVENDRRTHRVTALKNFLQQEAPAESETIPYQMHIEPELENDAGAAQSAAGAAKLESRAP